jgi:hypothetical protein
MPEKRQNPDLKTIDEIVRFLLFADQNGMQILWSGGSNLNK